MSHFRPVACPLRSGHTEPVSHLVSAATEDRAAPYMRWASRASESVTLAGVQAASEGTPLVRKRGLLQSLFPQSSSEPDPDQKGQGKVLVCHQCDPARGTCSKQDSTWSRLQEPAVKPRRKKHRRAFRTTSNVSVPDPRGEHGSPPT